MLLLSIAMWLSRKNPVQYAAYAAARNRIRNRHRSHGVRLGVVGWLTATVVHSGRTHRRSGSGELGTSGAYTAAGNPRTGNRRGPRKGY